MARKQWNEFAAEEKKHSLTSEGPTLPLLEDYARLNILSRTTKGLFPDVIPDERTLKELLEHFSDEQGAVPLESPNPLRKVSSQTVKISNFIDYTPEFEIKINDETWKQRKKALVYALATYRGRELGVAEEMGKMGLRLLETAEAMAREGMTTEEIRRKEEELRELSRAYWRVLEKRNQYVQEINRAFEVERDKLLEMLSGSYREIVEALQKVPESPEGMDYYEELVKSYDEGHRRVYQALAGYFASPKAAQEQFTTEITPELEEILRGVGGEEGYRKALEIWNRVYLPLIRPLSGAERNQAVENLKKFLVLDAYNWKAFKEMRAKLEGPNPASKDVEEALEGLRTYAGKPVKVQVGDRQVDVSLDGSTVEEAEKKIKRGEIEEVLRWIKDRKEKLEEIEVKTDLFGKNEIEAQKKILNQLEEAVRSYAKVEELRETLSRKIDEYMQKPLTLNLEKLGIKGKNLDEVEEEIKERVAELERLKNDEMYDLSGHPEVMEFYQEYVNFLADSGDLDSLARNLKSPDNEKLVNSAVKLYNLDLLLAKAREGKIPVSALSEEELSTVLAEPDVEFIRELKRVLENEANSAVKGLETPPLSASDYLQIIRTLKTLEFSKEVIEQSRGTALRFYEKFLEKSKEPGLMSAVYRGAAGLSYLASMGLSGINTRFVNCMEQVAFPPDNYPYVQPSARMRECFEKRFSEIERSGARWKEISQGVASPNPANPYLWFYYLYADFMSSAREYQKGFWTARQTAFNKELTKLAEELIFSGLENTDKAVRDMMLKSMGVSFQVKPLARLTPEEESPVVKEPREIYREFRKSAEKLRKRLEGKRFSLEGDVVGELEEFLNGFEETYRNVEELDTDNRLKKAMVELRSTLKEGNPSKLREAFERFLDRAEDVLSVYAEKNTIKFAVPGKKSNLAFVVEISPDKLREIGKDDLVKFLKDSNPAVVEKTKEKILRALGISREVVQNLLDSGELKNGLEPSKIFQTVTRAMALYVARGREVPEPEKTYSYGPEI